MTRGTAEAIHQPVCFLMLSQDYLYFILLKTLQEFNKLHVFQWKTCKKYLEYFFEWKICENLTFVTPIYRSFKAGDLTVVVLFVLPLPPCDQRLGDNTQCHADASPGCSNIMPS